MLTISAHGATFNINDPGGLMGKAIRLGGAYERKVLEHIFRLDLDGTAIDVGASVGNHALWLAAVCGLSVKAFEPLDFDRLEANVALNDLDITVYPIGLSDQAEKTTVTGPPSHVAGESFPSDGLVRVGRLDDFRFGDVALIKIDVEGMEPEVLRGAEETIARNRPVIFAEAESPEAHGRNAEVLDAYGYEHHKTFGATPLEEWRPC